MGTRGSTHFTPKLKGRVAFGQILMGVKIFSLFYFTSSTCLVGTIPPHNVKGS